MLTERTIINALIVGGSCILAPYLVFSTLTANWIPIGIFGALVLFFLTFFCFNDSLCLWPFIGLSIVGTLNFLPLPLNASNVFSILLIVYFVTSQVAMKQKRIKQGKLIFLVPILVVGLIVLYHMRSAGLRVLGEGSHEGSRPAFLILLTVVTYFCGINMAPPSVAFLQRIPIICVILSGISNLPYLATTFFPSLTPYLYYITDSVNVMAYFEAKPFANSALESGIGRLGSLGPFGGTLQLYLIANYPLATWIQPRRWWVPLLSLLCVAMVVASGFRNVLFGFLLLTFVGIWCHYTWRTLLIPAIAIVILGVLVVASLNNFALVPVRQLPLIAQRTLSFLPGDWDPEALESAQSSNDFRENIHDIYIKEYMMKSPWLGNGFSIDKDEYSRLSDAFYRQNNAPPDFDPAYTEGKYFIVGKNFHTGWISVYDAVGAIGSAAFITLGLAEIWVTGRLTFRGSENQKSPIFPLHVWLTVGIVSSMISFFTVFGDFAATFCGLCVYGLVLSQLCDIENEAYTVVIPQTFLKKFHRHPPADPRAPIPEGRSA
jgi:hypothetical protein